MLSKSNIETQDQYLAVGRRKLSVARAFLRTKGSGVIMVNQKPLETYFVSSIHSMLVQQPFEALKDFPRHLFDFYITVKGGGISGQAGAVRLAIARVLALHGGVGVHGVLRQFKLLTCDSRRVQSKNTGKRKARKKEQYRKR